MDKNRIMDDKKSWKHGIVHVHAMPKTGMQSIHKKYGLWIIGGGTNGQSAADGFSRCIPRYFEYYSISHMFSGRGRLWLENGEEQDVLPGDCVLITPNCINRYGGTNGQSYIEDALIFCGPVADMLASAGIISNGVFPWGKVRSLIPILKLAQDPAVDSQINANIALQKLLVELYMEKRMSRAEHPAVEKLIEEIKTNIDKWWTVGEMAEMCNLSDDQLRRVFLNHTGVRPKIYVDRLKLKQAAQMLTTTPMKIAEIAETLGYMDQYHFSRRFKKIMGLSPQLYRRSVPMTPENEPIPPEQTTFTPVVTHYGANRE